MMPNPMVAALQRLNGRECLINVETADEFLAGITRFSTMDRAAGIEAEVASRESLAASYGIDDDERPERKRFVYQDGVGVIPVHGSLINRFNSSWGFVTGYGFIRNQLNLMLDDDDVEQIIFDINSPGGEASGCFELAREIMASRRVKPSLAMVDALAASGGMAIGAAPTRMYAIPSARIGSIGVYRQHISIEKALADAGVKITFAQAGEHKTDGQPYKDLPESVLKDWTRDVNKTWDDFIDLVAEARGMEPEDVRATQASIYRADEALDKGLINAVKTVAEALPAFAAELAGDNPDEDGEAAMDPKGSKPEATSVDYEKIGQIAAQAATAAMSTMMNAQNRATAIREHGKAKGQVALAAKLTANDKLSEAEAIEMIDAAAGNAKPPKADKVRGKRPADKANAPGDDDDDDDDADEQDDADDQDDEDDQGDEDEAEQARAARRGQKVSRRQPRDKVNHFAGAMDRAGGERAGAGRGKDGGQGGGNADAQGTDALLGAHAEMTGTDLRKK